MEESPEPIIENTTHIVSSRKVPVEKSGWRMGFFVVLLILITVIAGGTYFYFNSSRPALLLNDQISDQTQQSTIPQGADMPVSSSNLITTPKNFMGIYVFQYPLGWHIANQWPINEYNEVTIFLDPNPLNFAPRGGPISALRMTDTSGNPNPDELFTAERNKFKASLTDEKEEIINSDFGPIYHYWGKIDYYTQMVDYEGYFFQLPGGVNDSINKHNIFATTDTNVKYSDVLKKIVLSFKKSQ